MFKLLSQFYCFMKFIQSIIKIRIGKAILFIHRRVATIGVGLHYERHQDDTLKDFT